MNLFILLRGIGFKMTILPNNFDKICFLWSSLAAKIFDDKTFIDKSVGAVVGLLDQNKRL